jgi:C_GCAxxG_C_C family probable redox protein
MTTSFRLETLPLPTDPAWIDQVAETARRYMIDYGSCAQGVLAAFMEALHLENPLVMSAAGAMHGGMLSSLTCGVHTGSMMVLGLFMGRENVHLGREAFFPIMGPGQELIRRLNKRLGGSVCRELSGVDFTDMKQVAGFRGTANWERCLNRGAEGAEETARLLVELNEQGELFRVKGA